MHHANKVSAKERLKLNHKMHVHEKWTLLYLLPPMHSAAIVMKECDAYREIAITGTDHIYATPHAVNQL